MAVTITADNGVSTGSAGLKQSADNTGVLTLQTTTAGGTATAALTINTSQNIGIGTSSPSYKLDAQTTATGTAAGDNTVGYFGSLASGRDANIRFGDNVNASARIGYLSGALYMYTNGAERMRLDTSGNLGIGTSSPGAKLEVAAGSGNIFGKFTSSNADPYLKLQNTSAAGKDWIIYSSGTGSGAAGTLRFFNNTDNITSLTLDSSGNLGLGVTPSAWGSGLKVIQVGNGAFSTYGNTNNSSFASNVYYDASLNPIYIASSYATQYQQVNGSHTWRTAASGTAGNAITFTQAMTLDASGNLGINNTSPSTFGKFVIQVAGTTTPTNATNIGPSSVNLYAASNGGSTDCTVGIFGWQASNPGIGSGLGFTRESSSNWGTQIRFYTHPADVASIGDITERARINSNGQFIVRSSLSGAGAITVGNNGGGGDNYGNIGLYTETSLGIGSIRCYDSTSTSLSGSIQWRDNYASLIAPSTNGLGTTGNGGVSFKVYTGSYSDAVVIEPSASMRPGADNNRTLGAASYRWSTVYAATGTINTSDANHKEQIAPLDEAEKRVATAIKGLVKKFKMKDAVAEKGDAARIHVGVIAQEVAAAFVAEGLDPTKYALFCEDTWWEKEYTREEAGMTELVRQAFDTETEGAEKKTRMGIRYEQLLAFIISAI